MTLSRSKYDSGCPVAYALDIFGDRWSLLVIRDMAVKGARTYGELLAGWEGISTNILAQRLKQLEAAGIVTKAKDPDNGRSYVYALTEKGRDLAPVLIEIALWSGRHNPAAHAMTGFLDKIEADRQGAEARMRAGELP
ncbi:winged helix-turn-helix transcriptional regulator [Leisingera sp. McT4-56]|uniref:winged helix-turn-helix transcriptional regulator n=1 Tax=Leisingera sp. McT4-56 TaxID=2881255 RepID=UPI001CF83D92|nr:helix-turn-helix domain-containing protein [Leisingera sp. McT4-56]MCB4456726.1 helix-turn-helix transcriptional regulator [Leisingera sp. McT4-56]